MVSLSLDACRPRCVWSFDRFARLVCSFDIARRLSSEIHCQHHPRLCQAQAKAYAQAQAQAYVQAQVQAQAYVQAQAHAQVQAQTQGQAQAQAQVQTQARANAQFQVPAVFVLRFAREAKLCQTEVVLCLRVCDVGKLFCITLYEKSKIVPNGVSIRPHHGFALARRMSSEMRLEF